MTPPQVTADNAAIHAGVKHMIGLLVSQHWLDRHGAELAVTAGEVGVELEPITLPADPAARLSPEEIARVDIAFFTAELFPDYSRSFFAAAQGAEKLQWLHVFNAGVDNPVFGRMLARGVRITTSSGSTASPISKSAITGLLMLARGFPLFVAQQREHTWARTPREALPADLEDQAMLVYGFGPIGREIARLGQALGLRVIGMRRSPGNPGDPVDEMRHPRELDDVLPVVDWLVVASPLTEETRGLFDERRLGLLPRGARVVNIARGEIVVEAALLDALRSGQIGGAYLDVFDTEPLPPESPFWDEPNVIISPHDSGASAGNEARVAGYFFANLRRWARGEELVNEVRPA